jgi:hypothetical protein
LFVENADDGDVKSNARRNKKKKKAQGGDITKEKGFPLVSILYHINKNK